ncbi:MAG: CRISPR-associated helicase Cas3' [Treponema sp.]|jgi:CRISPR-associated endonuclease/helicase Cas3|nr:CRISPR-associated helicase Cas3' [Treponema sp.]
MIYKARYRKDSNTEYQTLEAHLEETALYLEVFAKEICLPKAAFLIGALHDMGKNCKSWQGYLDTNQKFGKTAEKEDHATAGGRYVYTCVMQSNDEQKELVGQLLAACMMYHHGSGLPDVLTPDGFAKLYERLNKGEKETHSNECAAALKDSIKQKADSILSNERFVSETAATLAKLINIKDNTVNTCFNLGFTARFLSSCLIDADRTSSAFYERGIPAAIEKYRVKTDWKDLLGRLEAKLAALPAEGKLNEIRRNVSSRCADCAEKESGIYTLTAATGSGKTLASLRYALIHAGRYKKERIFVIAPYTSILDQNADVIRAILDPDGKNGNTILEHHSNLDRSELSEEYYIDAAQTWNVPIVITTMVQFLETLFGYGTRKIRRMHQLANAVIIFDEVQTLPVSCTYLFIWGIQYLCQNLHSSILFCTATQPGFDKLKSDKPAYALQLPPSSEIITDLANHFEELKRVELIDKTREKAWTLAEAAEFAESLPEQSVLIVVNTKPQAQKLYNDLSQRHPDWNIVHLSTNMCPAHRKQCINSLKKELEDKTKKIICISTRLIEAGVDIDFETAIRFLAGLDSIIQTAGRCNRNGNVKGLIGKTYIINIVNREENSDSLKELKHGQEIMKRILREYHNNEKQFNNTILHPNLIAAYFSYFYDSLEDSLLKHKVFTGRNDTVLDLLSFNRESKGEFERIAKKKYGDNPPQITLFRQSFESAWKAFEVISSDTAGVLVPFEKGKDIITELYTDPCIERTEELVREAQQYSVNVYYNTLNQLIEKEIIRKITLKTRVELYAVEDGYYNAHTGLTGEFGELTMLYI